MATRIRTLNFLPEIFQTPTNAQFLAASLDQIVSQPLTKTIQGFIGSKFGYGINAKDYYVTEPTKVRTDYQLDPGVVFTKTNESTAQDFISYPGILDALKLEGALTEDNNRLFTSEFYSWDSFTDLDKVINYYQYYWIPEGPEQVVVATDTIFNTDDYIVIDNVNGYDISSIISPQGGTTNPTLTLLRGGVYTFTVNQESQFWIQGYPGVTGYSPTQTNLQTRDVYGVENNGASVGVVTFTVPLKDAQDYYNFPGNNLVDVVSTLPFDQVNGARLKDLIGIDGVTSLNGLSVMFYNTGVPNEIGYVSNFLDYTNYDYNNNLVATKTINITATASIGNRITCSSTKDLVVGNTIVFSGVGFGGLSIYSETLPDTLYYIESVDVATVDVPYDSLPWGDAGWGALSYPDLGTFSVSLTLGGPPVLLSNATGNLVGTINDGLLEEGFYSTVNENFYTIEYLGDLNDPVIRLLPRSAIPTNQKITATFGTQWINRNFYKESLGPINIIPFLSAPLDTLYYQDGTSANKVGKIRIIDNNITNIINVETDILGQKQYTAPNGVIFTNGLKVVFRGEIFPESYNTGQYYVEGVGTSIQLVPVRIISNIVSPYTKFVDTTYIPWDIIPWDIGNWEGTSYLPITPDYITIARNSIDRNAWSRSNRWFHIDVINATAEYNNDPTLIELYTTPKYKAKRPIIEFNPNLQLFNSCVEGKDTVDYIDFRTTDAFSQVAGQENYYPDVVGYTGYDAIIAPVVSGTSTTIVVPVDSVQGTFLIGQYVGDSTNLLPNNSYITDIVTTTTTVTLTIGWQFNNTFLGTSVASIISTDTTIDNYALFTGSRIVFAADTNENVRNKVYISRFSSVNGSTPIITLTEASDGLVLVNQGVAVLRGYASQGLDFYFDGLNWITSQQKIDVNQAPLFDIFDDNGISFGDTDIYTGSSFIGNKLFAYGIGSGEDDTVLGFPLSYSSLDNLGDISFDVSLNADSFNYVQGTVPITQRVNTGYVHQTTNRTEYVRQLGWQTAVSPSIQYQIFEFEYDVLNPTTTFTCDIAMVDITDTNWPTIEVYINNLIQDNTTYTVTVNSNSTVVTLNDTIIDNTVIQILILSDQVSKTAYYNVPINLTNNPFNTDLTTANVGDIRGQYQSMFFNNPNTIGPVFGSNNFRDLGNLVPWGNRIIQNSASLVLPSALLRKQNHNLFNALLFNNREYIKFKTLLVDTVNNTDYVQRYSSAEILDDALDQITLSKTDNQPFFWSDMLPSKAAYISNSYTYANTLNTSIYPLSRTYDFTKANYYGVLVYLTRTVQNISVTKQLIINQDYTVSTDAPSLIVTLDVLPNDTITIKEYNQTFGSYVPNTPTKLGLYPAYIPNVVLDKNYSNPTYFILGHDGSYNKLYGDYFPETNILVDFRDQALLEYETRVYNNLKLSSPVPVQEYEVLPGFFRNTDYSFDEWLDIYSSGFLNWVGQNRLDYKKQVYQTNNEFTYNYWQSGNGINKEAIYQGYWRGIYQYYYDTSTPNTSPWEMLGFVNKPSWWETRYGSAPYTSDNLVLWTDLSEGINWNNGDPVVIPQAIRPGLLQIIPVDSSGNLLSPIRSVVGNYNSNIFQRDWKVGDEAPVEFSYRRSSSYPFDLMRILALTKPAEFFNLGVDLDNYKYSEEFNQYLINNRSHLVISDIEIYGSGTAKTSYINWIVDYEKQVGVDATANITTLLDNLDVRLVYRLAGFSDKNLLKFYVEKSNPNSNNASLLIPDESYSVLLYDNQPFNRVVYSGVIVQITKSGFLIFGNSQTHPYFKTLKPFYNGKYESITVENATVKILEEHDNVEVIIPYNTEYGTYQEVANFLSNYGAWLTRSGLVFEQQQYELVINWNQMIAEFLYWAQTGWDEGSIITLNPCARTIAFNKDSNIVQPLTIQQTNFILNQNLYPIQNRDLAIIREDTLFTATALNDGDAISYAQFNISNFEHGIVFDNVTLFNDIIYNLITGLRQNRINLQGTKSADWNGTVDAQGFIYNQDNIKEWDSNATYTKGEIVLYKNKYWVALTIVQPKFVFNELEWKITDYNEVQKGLLPNSSTRSYESTLYYDINKANLENDADLLSFSLIGYRPRDYLALADLTDITQINVYKNFIKNKGTRNSTDAFKGANLPQGGIQYNLYENWAIKSGEFGGILNSNFVQFKINQNYMTGNPSIVGLTNGIYNEGVQQEVPIYSLFNYGRPINTVDILPTISAQEPSTVYPTAGYVNFNDVKMSSYFYSQLPLAVDKNNLIVLLSQFYVRDYVWLANYLQRWEVFTPKSMGIIYNVSNNLNDTVTVTFKTAHNLKIYEPFAIINFSDAINGYYIATAIIDQYRVLISSSLDPSIVNITGQGVGFRLQSQRVSTPSSIINLPLLDSEFFKNTVWVDENTDGGWAVYRKSINYQYHIEFTKPSSVSYGSAVATNSQLGYLIGDSGVGSVYRYAFNELTQNYDLIQTINSGVSFGSTISYNKDLYIISEPTTAPKIYIYQLQNSKLSDDLILYQPAITAPGGVTNWGSAVAISGDTNWIYVSDIDNNTVHVYRKSNIVTPVANLTAGQTYIITTAGTTDFTTVGATSSDVGTAFVATGVGTGTGVATKSTYQKVTTIDGDALSLTVSGDNFGYSLATDYYGDTLIIGTPNKDYSVTVDNWGYVYVFARAVQNIQVQTNSFPLTSQVFDLAWTPTSLSKTLTATNSTGNLLTLNNVSGITVDDPIIFSGSTLAGTQIVADQIYYVRTIVGSTISIKTSRFDTAAVTVATVSSLSISTTVQNTPIYVSVNGTLVDDSNYAVVGSTLVYTETLSAGDIINVSGQEFTLMQTLTTENTPKVGVHFGNSVDTTIYASEIIVGAPYELITQNKEGAVYCYTNGGGKYGMVLGTSDVNVTSARKVLINGFLVNVPIGNATTVANAINAVAIPNIVATVIDSKLMLSLVDNNLAQVNEKILLSSTDSAALGELGIDIYTQTQIVECPHTNSRTQFGTTVKFNEYGSFVASAPVGTRFASTTFDFIDDENQDNDTVFDNNSTVWIDTFPNAGAVYMFDYLSNYNENLINCGKFVYAQSVNSQDLEYGLQPNYGTALDFHTNNIIIGTPEFSPTNGQAIIYNNISNQPNWSVYRSSAPVVDINNISNIQLFSAQTNQTLINMDYIDPLQGKILGAARENLDYISNSDPVTYNNKEFVSGNLVWGEAQLGQLWFNTTNIRYVNYHQNDNTYNSTYWGTLFPNSDVAVYTWITSDTLPINYIGPGTVYDPTKFVIQYTINSSGALTPIYFYWVRDTGIISPNLGKTLSDNTVAAYIANPKNSGISYFAPLLPSVYGLYNVGDYINANDSVLNIGFGTGTGIDTTHNQYDLIRANFADDFLPGLPDVYLGETEPYSLYARLLDSLSGTDTSGQVVPNPFLPLAVQTGVLVRPRQSFFYDRLSAVKNFFQAVNEIVKEYPLFEISDATFTYASGEFFDATNYWENINWWAPGYNDNTKSTIQVAIYSDLATLSVTEGTIATVETNGLGLSETYLFSNNEWVRIGLTNGTIQFKSSLWDYASARIGFGDNFFDTSPYDYYPSEETRWLVRALTEQLPSELLIYRNKILILMFEYIISEADENQNYLPWLNKTSLIDVDHTIRELVPIEVFRGDNQAFLEGYLNEVKPYHVVIKDFLFKYTKTNVFQGDITDFDLPSQFNTVVQEWISPQLVYKTPDNIYQYLPNDPIWEETEYSDWFNNSGVSITGQDNVQITTLSSYVTLTSAAISVNNSLGFPINGIIQIGDEQIGYASVDRNLNVLYELTRGVNGTPISNHLPGELIYIDLPAVLVLDGGRGYIDPPKVTAYIDPILYPPPKVPAVLSAVMNLDSVLRIDVIDPGMGYAVLPKIIIDPSNVISFSSSAVNTTYSIITLYAPLLQTGDLVQYKVGIGSTAIGGIENDQWYYVNLLETIPAVVIALFSSYTDAINNTNRIKLLSVGSGTQQLCPGARASSISSATPVRENNITLKFDRTSYNSNLIEWTAGKYYGAYYAGNYNNSAVVASSSIKLESTEPPINSVLASSGGVVFEIEEVRNDRVVIYSSLVRQVASTHSSDNSITLTTFSNNPLDINASGSTIGFYVGMPIKFDGNVIGGLLIDTVYYVHSIIDDINFTISENSTGSPIKSLTNGTVNASGLKCYVGEKTDTAILSVIYPGITNVTATNGITNTLTIPLNLTGTGGTNGFYTNLPMFFTGTMLGGLVENQVYYVTSVLDNQTFTISEEENPQTLNIISTNGTSDYIVTSDVTSILSINLPIVFDSMVVAGTQTTSFGGLSAKTIYYVSNIVNSNTFQVSTSVNGLPVNLTTVSASLDTSALLTSQKNVVKLVTDAGDNMIVDINLPVSPGQVNGQQFTLYKTSNQFVGLTGTSGSLINRTIAAVIDVSDSIALTDASGGLDNIYINMPIEVSQNIGSLTTGTTYYVVNMDTVEIECYTTSSSTNAITCDNTEFLYVDMPIIFTGLELGGIRFNTVYYVHTIVDSTHFTISEFVNGIVKVLQTSNGDMYGTGGPYIQVSTSLGGPITSPGNSQQNASISVASPAVVTVAAAPANGTKVQFRSTGALPTGLLEDVNYYVVNSFGTTFEVSYSVSGSPINTTASGSGTNIVIVTDEIFINQTVLATPIFDVSYIMGGYRAIITDPGLGYAVNNTISISGTNLAGTSPLNDLTITVASVSGTGEIVSVSPAGRPTGITENYYLKVISPTEFAVYENPSLTVPVSGIDFPYIGTISTTVTATNSSTDIITVTSTDGFLVNDPIVFTGNVAGGLVIGQTYYIVDNINFTATTLQVSETPDGSVFNITATTSLQDFSMAKDGDYAVLPEPFYFTQSIVKYNNRTYICIVSNNDTEFILGKWQLLSSDDRRLNALDRINGYYQPTINMPGLDLTQLVEGITYPNSTYLGNAFAPDQQFEIDTYLQDQAFYPTRLECRSIIWNGYSYHIATNSSSYPIILTSIPTISDDWSYNNLTDSAVTVTDIIRRELQNNYIITTTNTAVPILSGTVLEWTSVASYVKLGETKVIPISNGEVSLNSIYYYNGTYLAVGQNIITSEDGDLWRERFKFENNGFQLVNELFDVFGTMVNSTPIYIAVGRGQEVDYSTGVRTVVDVNLVYTSYNIINWNKATPVTNKGFNSITYGNNIFIAVGDLGVTYTSINGVNWLGVNESYVTSVNSSTDIINVTATAGFSINNMVRFTQSFNNISASTTYYVVSIPSLTQIKISTTLGGSPITLTSVNPSSPTYMYLYPRTSDLNSIIYANNTFMAVGNDGLIKTSSTGYTWVTQTSGTVENLNNVIYNDDLDVWVAIGDNNAIINSDDNGVTWTNNSVIVVEPTVYDVQGAEFSYGYGPEELVPGNVVDNLVLTVTTRPGTNWPAVEYQNVGYNVVSTEITPETQGQLFYSFKGIVNNPVQIQVSILYAADNGLGTVLCPLLEIDYSVDWVNSFILLNSSYNLSIFPVPDKVRIEVYETGNGYQLVKSSTKYNPIITNSVTGWNEINLNCNYSDSLFNGSGVIRPDAQPKTAIAIATTSGINSITCIDVDNFLLNSPITFQGLTFGGILENTIYYVKTISYVTGSITVSTSFSQITGTAGPTLSLSSDTGSMFAIIKVGAGSVWSSPLCYVNGYKLRFGTTETVTRTNGITNTITCHTTGSLTVGQDVTFSNTMFGGVIQPQTVYKILSIFDANEFVLEDPNNIGYPLALTTATGGAEIVTNDYAFAIGDNGITAKIVFAVDSYDALYDYITYTVFGETTPNQFGYTIPETQYIVTTSSTEYDLYNYMDSVNAENAIVEKNGLRIEASDFVIDSNLDTITLLNFTPGDIISVTSFNLPDQQYLNTMDPSRGSFDPTLNYAVLAITDVNNTITPYLATVTVLSCTSVGNLISCDPGGTGTSGFVIGQTIQFKGTGFGNIQTSGIVYYIKTINSAFTFTISLTYLGSTFSVGNGSGAMVAYVGGNDTVRITSPQISSNFNTNDLVRIDGIEGSTQLNNNTYYLHIIGPDQADLYLQPYNTAFGATNYPITSVSSYISGGYVWVDSVFTLITTVTKQTTTDTLLGNRIVTETLGYNGTVNLVPNTPVIFTSFLAPLGSSIIGGLIAGTTYYVKRVYNSTEFSVSSTLGGDEFVLTNDSSLTPINVTQWEQFNVDRVWVTVDGYRVPSSKLRLNPANNLSILTPITFGTPIIITSMMPSPTPQEETYLLSVNLANQGEVYRANAWDTTWLTAPLLYTSDTIYVDDLSRLTITTVQNNIAPTAVNGEYSISLIADKNIISSIAVFNDSTSQFIDSDNYKIVIEDLTPVLKIKAGVWISAGNNLEIQIVEGNTLIINGEQIKFTIVDFNLKTISGLQRGANGTGIQNYIPKYSVVYGLLSSNRMSDIQYNQTWNSYYYNTVSGDPLQISNTPAAIFLNGGDN
jgi:hypothetical protein